MSEPVVVIDDVWCGYGGEPILRGVDLVRHHGAAVLLVSHELGAGVAATVEDVPAAVFALLSVGAAVQRQQVTA